MPSPHVICPVNHVVCPLTKYHIVSDTGHKALCPVSLLGTLGMGLGTLDVDWAYQTRRLGILYVVAGIMLYTSASESLRRVINMRVWIVSYFGSILGVYSCAVDANQTARQLRRTGSADAIVTEARLNEETCTGKTLLATVPTATSEA